MADTKDVILSGAWVTLVKAKRSSFVERSNKGRPTCRYRGTVCVSPAWKADQRRPGRLGESC